MSQPTPPAPACPAEPAGHERGRQRWQRVRWTAAAALTGRGLALLGTLITIPLTLNYLGPVRYGYWVAIVSTTMLLSFADFGLGYGLLNRASAAFGRNDLDAVRRQISNTWWLLAAIAALGIALLLLAGGWLPWAKWFPGAEAASAECARAVIVIAVAFLIALPFTTAQRALASAQLGYWNPAWDAIAAVISLAALLLVIARHGGLVSLALAYAGGPLLAAGGAWVWVFLFYRPQLRPRRIDWDSTIAFGILREGSCYLVLQIGGVVLAAASSLIIMQQRGPVELADFNLVSKVFQVPIQLAAFWFAPLWPAYSEALARGDFAWAQETLKRTTLRCALGALGISFVFVPLANAIVRLWTGRQIDGSLTLRMGLAAAAIALITTTSISTYLNASRFLAGQAWLAAAQVVWTLVLAWWWCANWGSAGVAWATFAGYVLVVVPTHAVVLKRILPRQRETPSSG